MSSQFYGRVGADTSNTIPEGVEKLKREVRRRLIKAMEAAGGLVAERAYDKANVSAGVVGHALDGTHMRDNIEVNVVTHGTVVEARIGVPLSNVPYAPHQEFGDRGKPFLRPAMDESRQECHDIIQSVMDGTAAEDSSSFVRFMRGSRPSSEE